MVRLKIADKIITGTPEVDIAGTLDGVVTPDSVSIMAPRQLSETAWFNRYTTAKIDAISVGGSAQDDNAGDATLFAFNGGYVGSVVNIHSANTVLLSLHGVNGTGTDGMVDLLPSKTIDILPLPEKHEIRITRAPNTPSIHKLYNDIYLMSWRLYHAFNSISGRLQLWAPKMPVDGSAPVNGLPHRRISKAGRYLGTYLQYQSLVALWNHYAWKSSFYLDVIEAGERLAIVVGYTNLECKRDTVSYTMTVTPLPETEDPEVDVAYKSKLLTIYNQGSDSTLDTDYANAQTIFYRNEEPVSGSGYEGRSPGEMTSIGLSTTITAKQPARAAMLAEQYHRNLVAIAPCIGIDQEYSVQPGVPTVFMPLSVSVTWTVDGKNYTKTTECKLAAVGIATDDEEGASK